MEQKKKNNLSKLIVIIGSIVAIIGCFLPFASVFGYGVNFAEGDGIFVIVLSVIAIVIALFKAKIAWIANVLALVVTIYDMSKISEISSDLLGSGAYIIVIASIAAVVGSIMSWGKKNKNTTAEPTA